jgi:hypothetical protein
MNGLMFSGVASYPVPLAACTLQGLNQMAAYSPLSYDILRVCAGIEYRLLVSAIGYVDFRYSFLLYISDNHYHKFIIQHGKYFLHLLYLDV